MADTKKIYGNLEVKGSSLTVNSQNVPTESSSATLSNKSIDADNNTITNIANSQIKAAAAIDASKIANGSVSNAEFQYLGNVTSDIQDQLDAKIASTQKGANNGVATLDAGGKVPVSQLPNSVMEFKGVFNPATATFTDASGNAGDVYLASAAGSYDAGSGSITYAIGDWAVHNGTIFEKSLNSNAVVSVNSQTGVVVLTKSDVGLGNVDNTSDVNKPISTATQTALDLKYDASNPSNFVDATGAASAAPVQSVAGKTGVVSLVKADVGLSNVDNTSDVNKPISTATQSALDLKYDTSNPANYVDATGAAAAAPVQSVAGKTGTVSLVKADVGLGNVDNTSDANKPISTATQTALDLKYDASNPDNFVDAVGAASAAPVQSVNSQTGTVVLTKSDVGLGNVDNTSDANKPVSTAQQTALDLKLNLSGGTLTGALTLSGAPTADLHASTKKYVDDSIAAIPSMPAGDIAETSFSITNNQASAADITGFAFANASIRSFKAIVSVAIDATASKYEAFDIQAVQHGAGWYMSVSSVGDDSGVIFSITSAGQVQYTSTNNSGFVSGVMKFRAQATHI